MTSDRISRRTLIRNTALAAAGAAVAAGAKRLAVTPAEVTRVVKNGRIYQSVSKWCYG